MNKKFLISWLVVFVVWMAGSFAVHGTWLQQMYAGFPNLFRTQEDTQQYFYLMLLAHIIMAGAFVWIYQRGAEDKPPITQGLRFGAAIALLAVVPTYMIYFVVQPISAALAMRQTIGDAVLCLVLGVIVAFLNRPQPAAA